jgi:DNA-binding transcriptional regulator YiaG
MAFGHKEKKEMSHWTGEKIRELRRRYAESQPTFASRLRVHADTVRWWEQGRGVPSGPAEVVLDRLLEDIDSGQVREIPSVSQAPASAS